MVGFRSPFGGDDESDQLFDDPDEFVPANISEPGWFLEGHAVLDGDAHLGFHHVTEELFEERGVYDMTFGYNLARLNLDTRHRDAGYRYAEDADDPSVLRAEFTPTTPFCPQSDTLTKGSFRAWNGLSDRHDYDLVRVRVDEMHHRAAEINDQLEAMEASPADDDRGRSEEPGSPQARRREAGCSSGTGGTSRGYGADAPF